MNRKDAIETENMLRRLEQIGIARNDAEQLRRIAMTLHRWSEMECGVDHGCIERDEKTDKPYWLSTMHLRSNGQYSRWPIPDRERGAQRRLAKILARYPALRSYIQTDPRGAPLYILPPDVTAENYNRGVAVYK